MVRRHEVSAAALDDAHVLEQARQGKTTEKRVLKRAELLAPELGFDAAIQQWNSIRRLLFAALAVLAILAGVGFARGALATSGIQGGDVSLVYAVLVLLGFNIALLLAWAITLFTQNEPRGVGSLGLTLAEKLIRDPKTRLASESVVSLAGSHSLAKPLFSVFTHAFWLVVMAACWLALFLMLGGQSYTFEWSTTIMSAETMAAFTNAVGWLPALAGFQAPGLEQLNINPALSDHRMAGQWLLAMVGFYGVLLRFVLLFGSLAVLKVKIARMKLDTAAPGIQALIPRLTDKPQEEVVDKDPGEVTERKQAPTHIKGTGRDSFSLDYEPEQAWKERHPVVASGQQKKAFLQLQQQSPTQILVVRIQASLTPDRGSLRFLEQLQQTTESLRVWLVTSQENEPQSSHQPHWVEALQLRNINFTDNADTALGWLND